MSQSNKLFKWAKYNGNSNAYDSDTDDSNGPTNINKDMFSSILRHPYMEQLEENNDERNYLVIYRIKTYNEVYHVVEFYILNILMKSIT